MKTGKRIRAWHFCAGDKLRDGTPLVVGKTYTVKGELVMCKRGLHWSRRIIDALKYAPGDTICLVEAWGDVQEQDDKGVSTHRKVLAKVAGEKLLRLFACDVAEEALNKCNVTDERSRNAIAVSRRYANGKATKEELSAARSAAWSAAESAARRAAWSAAWSAAESAAWNAAWSAARRAAESAAWNAAWDAQNDKLTAIVLKAMKRKSMDGK